MFDSILLLKKTKQQLKKIYKNYGILYPSQVLQNLAIVSPSHGAGSIFEVLIPILIRLNRSVPGSCVCGINQIIKIIFLQISY